MIFDSPKYFSAVLKAIIINKQLIISRYSHVKSNVRCSQPWDGKFKVPYIIKVQLTLSRGKLNMSTVPNCSFQSLPKPRDQIEAWCTTIHVKMRMNVNEISFSLK